jgi:hypothetical protein
MAGRGLVALAVAGLVLASGPRASAQDADLCARLASATPAVAGEVGEPALVETSGLAASRAHDGVLWAHNDSGDQPRVFALGEDGEALGAYAVDGAENVDWEDVAVGPGPDGASALYLGDIGQNGGLRDPVTVYRVPEPDAAPDGAGGTLAGAEALALTYPSGSVDAEALLVDPVTGDLFVVTKVIEGTSTILRAAADDLAPGAPIAMEEAGTVTVTDPGEVDGATFPGTLVTGADISPDGSVVVLRTYKEVLAYARPEGATVAEALAGEPCAVPVPGEPQGEAVAVTGAGDALVTISELGPTPAGEPLPVHRIALAPAEEPEPDPTTSTSTSPSTTAADRPAEGGDEDGDRTPVVVGAIAVLVVLAAGAGFVLRRRGRD